jgi:hypothetical protein
LGGQFVPYAVCDYKKRTFGVTNQTLAYCTPALLGGTQNKVAYLQDIKSAPNKLKNVDIVFTSDKSKWSRCIVIETNNFMYEEQGLESQKLNDLDKKKENFDLRGAKSKGSDTDPNGTDNTTGKSWFPGYAIDVETGKRLNLFFGENSGYDPAFDLLDAFAFTQPRTGRDMIWNPTADAFVSGGGGFPTAINLAAGCGHYIYVTENEYDGCAELYTFLNKTNPDRRSVARRVTWTSMPVLRPGTKLLSYAEGIIPNDLTAKLRVDNPYQIQVGTNVKLGYPTYQFTMDGVQSTPLDSPEKVNAALEAINVVPNPYYAYSAYELSQFTSTVKITNLPAKCVVSIYSLDGKFIRQYRRDEVEEKRIGTNPGISQRQITPALEWDMKNTKNIPVASGTYLIHVSSDLGERTIKWFGVMRPFDPSGL